MAESLNTSKESATRWWWSTRVAGAVVYALVLSLLGYAITQLQEEGGDGKGAAGSHAAAIRACVVRPTGETLEDVGGLESIKEALRRAVLRLLRHPTCVRRRCVTVVLTPVVVQLAAVTWVRGPGVGVGVVADARWGGNWSGGHHLCDV